MLAERYGVKGQTLRKQYKEKISDYRNWDQLEHAHDYLLYPENIGENLSLDETCLSNGDVYTILTNKAAKGRKGALVAMVRGVATDAVSGILRRLPHRKRLSVKTVTTDLSSAMMLTVRKVFPAAKLINDRFHVQQLMSEAVDQKCIICHEQRNYSCRRCRRGTLQLIRQRQTSSYHQRIP